MAGTIFVAAANSTSSSRARVSLGRLSGVDANVIGAILTKYDVKSSTYGYGYGYDYGYGYGRTES